MRGPSRGEVKIGEGSRQRRGPDREGVQAEGSSKQGKGVQAGEGLNRINRELLEQTKVIFS